jgi:uncharacterized protein YnzC (UPF0291/DUF896 family)
MPVVQIEAQLSPDKLLQAVNQLSEPELEQFAIQVNSLIARRKAPWLPNRESELLLKINRGVPSDMQARHEELAAKRDEETLTPEEHAELLRLSHEIEMLEAKRVEYLAELAQLRQTSLTTLMQDLGIHAPDYAA